MRVRDKGKPLAPPTRPLLVIGAGQCLCLTVFCQSHKVIMPKPYSVHVAYRNDAHLSCCDFGACSTGQCRIAIAFESACRIEFRPA